MFWKRLFCFEREERWLWTCFCAVLLVKAPEQTLTLQGQKSPQASVHEAVNTTKPHDETCVVRELCLGNILWLQGLFPSYDIHLHAKCLVHAFYWRVSDLNALRKVTTRPLTFKTSRLCAPFSTHTPLEGPYLCIALDQFIAKFLKLKFRACNFSPININQRVIQSIQEGKKRCKHLLMYIRSLSSILFCRLSLKNSFWVNIWLRVTRVHVVPPARGGGGFCGECRDIY